MAKPERVETLVIGGGQAGLAVGYQLAQRGESFLIVDANARTGDAWRRRWDSLRLFSPARYDGLAGLLFPGPRDHYPTKDAMADYLESYAAHFNLPVRCGVRVDRLSRSGDRFIAQAGETSFEADQVVVAMSSHQVPQLPPFSSDLDPSIRQLHSTEYRNQAQLQAGPVLVVGAGNSGAEVALDVAAGHETILAGRDTGHIPFRIESRIARLILVRLVLGFVFSHVFTIRTPIGRKMRAGLGKAGMPVVRTKPSDLARAGVERVGRVVGIRDGRPMLDDGRRLEVANVIWATGYRPSFDWIDLPAVSGQGPEHDRGIVSGEPGLFFVGLEFQYAVSSGMVQGVSRDAAWVVRALATRRSSIAPTARPAPARA
jgi:putative flavoprotein involved in K+ transport